MIDISDDLIAHNYANVAADNYFYVWLDRTAGANEMTFATELTTSAPTDL
jgi:hypothetical protein